MDVEYSVARGRDAEDMPNWRMEGEEIRAYHYPFCCTGVVLANLGGSSNQYGVMNRTAEEIKSGIEKWIDWFTVDVRGLCQGKQFISVCTTDEQAKANSVLRGLGFKKSVWLTNYKYKNTKLCTWMLPIGHI